MDNENYLIIRKSDGSIAKIEIEKDVLVSGDKIIRVHKVLPVDEPAYYMIEQYQTVNPDDIRGRAWRTICETPDFASAKRFIFAHNIGDREFQSAMIRRFDRFGCPVSCD